MAGKGGGAWKVAYADFVTAMMAFFMVMWLTAQKPEVKEGVASYFRDPFADKDGGADSKGPKRPRAPVNSVFPPTEADKQRPISERDSPANRVPAPTIARRATEAPWIAVNFPVGEARLTEEARDQLSAAAEALVGKPNRVELRAHTVRKPLPEGSPFRSHWELCFAQAEAVREALVAGGVESYRFRLSQSEGNEPANAAVDRRAVAQNSRVDLYILNEFADPPPGVVAGPRRRAIDSAPQPADRKKAEHNRGEER